MSALLLFLLGLSAKHSVSPNSPSPHFDSESGTRPHLYYWKEQLHTQFETRFTRLLKPSAFPRQTSLTSSKQSTLTSSSPSLSTMPATPIPRRGPQNAFTRRLAKIGNWELTSLFSRPYTNPNPRKVLVNCHVPPEAYTTAPKLPLWSKQVKGEDGKVRKVKQGLGTKEVPAPGWTFQTNQVLTSKYNIVTFLPRNLLEQFRRVANIFFLGKFNFPSSRCRFRRALEGKGRCLYATMDQDMLHVKEVHSDCLGGKPSRDRQPPLAQFINLHNSFPENSSRHSTILPSFHYRQPWSLCTSPNRRALHYRPQRWIRRFETTSK